MKISFKRNPDKFEIAAIAVLAILFIIVSIYVPFLFLIIAFVLGIGLVIAAVDLILEYINENIEIE